ncbi:MAG: hypothetical protein NTW95_06060 [Candidatus Aminicenantes bacterium]|nr:hypothetical protein [Candidatus Aminicenantes bacterium]
MPGSVMKLQDISRDDVYDFTWPPQPQRLEGIEAKFPGLPLVVVDAAQRIVWGHDYFRLLLAGRRKDALVFEGEFNPTEALLLNFNLSNRLFELNLCEKLLFIRKISRCCKLVEIRRRAELGFALNEALLERLDVLLDVSMRPLLAAGQLCLKAAMRLADFAPRDRKALLGLFGKIGFSESHQLQVIQLLEETAFRKKRSVASILAATVRPALLEQEMPQQKILEALQRRRFPALSRQEDEWRQWQKKASIPNRLALGHAPFFCSGEVRIVLTAKDRLEAEELLKKLK